MAEGKWQYKGFTIELTPSASFAAEIGDKYYSGSSLSAAKKAIDKHLEEKAKDVKLSLPVVMVLGNSRFDETNFIIKQGVITGVDQKSIEVQGLDERRNFEYTLPDSKANMELSLEYVKAQKVLTALKKKLEARSINLQLSGYSSLKKTPYHEAIKTLQDRYEAAKKAKSEE